ncbi:transporter, CPA2 family (TC 2.A.37) [Desulfonatronum thiosulfatophilum]|uniref:Transporter, CPA2 family (TC 2.A.37) n=1 Tax=Desulfonatronum thiosulfatophilum TaxID=617002 RepID=A0A1G6AI54_9BACT|nr:cation:proton antiporter family protein [Desulfonatronum thiosulfatophilum]SDB08065.1 transporter, CPA2 family (TC 2.A.37) [Desulfonatronum thiosulfatophilum]
MLVILVSFAFAFGLALTRIGLPPMVGFLVAGFAYHMIGLETPQGLDFVADLGIKLLLFSIGLKLDVRGLLKAEIWASSMVQMLVTTAFMCGVLLLGQYLFQSSLMDMSWQTVLVLGFALAFSSTVFAVKVLEEKGDLTAFYGRIAIGILIMQDLFAVLFLSASAGKLPSIWALSVLALPLLRPVLYKLMDMAGRGELFILCGLFIALGVGAEGFSLVGLKPDLGALVLGVLIAGHPRASELSKALFGFKELMLVGFFLSIGMTGLPTLEMLVAAVLLCLLLPFKTGIYHFIVSQFGLRARSSLFASLSLTNYSEFGLIVAAIAVGQGLLTPDWLLVMAMTVSISFAVSSPLSTHSEYVYRKIFGWLCRFERSYCHPHDAPIDLGDVKAVVLGMGRIGSGAYDELQKTYGKEICGVEHAPDRVDFNRSQGRNVILGDACDTEFWLKLRKDLRLELVILAMPNHYGNMYAAQQLRNFGFECQVAAIARFPEEVEELSAIGVCTAYNMYEQAGAGLVRSALEGCRLSG